MRCGAFEIIAYILNYFFGSQAPHIFHFFGFAKWENAKTATIL